MSEYYKADATSRLQIRAVAKEIRNLFGLQNRFEFPIVEVFETLSVCGEFNFEILTRAEMGNKYGETFPGKIKFRSEKIFMIKQQLEIRSHALL